MSDFSVGALLEAEIDRRSLREDRKEIEDELGDVSVSVGTTGGSGTGAGASMLDDVGTNTSELVGMADQRNETLEDILDELEDATTGPNAALASSAGGLIGGGGGGGGGFLQGFLGGVASQTKNVAKRGATSGALSPGSPLFFMSNSLNPSQQKQGPIADFLNLPQPQPPSPEAKRQSKRNSERFREFVGVDPTPSSASGPEAAATVGAAARAGGGGAFGVAANELQFLEDTFGIGSSAIDKVRGGSSGSPKAATARTRTVESTGSQPAASKPQSVTVNPTINVQVGGQRDLQRAIDSALEDIRSQLQREIERSVIGDIEDSVTSAAGNLGI